MNLLVPVLLAKFGATSYRKANQRMLKSRLTFLMYWAVTIVILLWNTSNLIASAYVYIESKGARFYPVTGSINTYSDEMATLAARITLLPLVYLLELLIAAYIPKDTGLLTPSVIQRMFFCCLCFSSSIQSKIIQTLAVWNIMIFIHNQRYHSWCFLPNQPVVGGLSCGFNCLLFATGCGCCGLSAAHLYT